jgi:hypothetical protein
MKEPPFGGFLMSDCHILYIGIFVDIVQPNKL